MFNPGELPLVLLALAEIEPMRAYDFIDELERRFGPAYRPSPGGVYPAIQALADEGLLRAAEDGRAKRYSLTRSGRAALEKRRRQLAAVEERTGARLRGDSSARPALERFVERVVASADQLDADDVQTVLDRAAVEIEKLARRAK